MAANKPAWPNCGCLERCRKPKCNRTGGNPGSRELAQQGEGALGPGTMVAMGLVSRPGAQGTMRRILNAAKISPVITVICKRANVSRTLLKYWLALSRKGKRGDWFDLPIDVSDGSRNPMTERFHVLFEDAMEAAWDGVEQKAFALATGTEREILNHQGHVTYLSDPVLLALGVTGEQAYLRDKNGDPIPETVPLLDPEMVRWVLSRRRSDQYGNKMKVEHEHKGGVLVVGATKSSKELEQSYKDIKHNEIEDVEFEEVEEESGLPNA